MTTVDEVLCKLPKCFHCRKKELAGPYLCVTPGGDVWRVATDSKRIVWARGFSEGPDGKFPSPDREVEKKLFGIFEPHGPTEIFTNISIGALLTVVGETEWEQKCPACLGRSAVNEHVNCSFCDNNGFTMPDGRYGYIAGAPVNMALLAPLVELFVGHRNVDIIVETNKGNHKVLWLIADGLRAALISMKDDSADEEEKEKWSKAPHWPAEFKE